MTTKQTPSADEEHEMLLKALEKANKWALMTKQHIVFFY